MMGAWSSEPYLLIQDEDACLHDWGSSRDHCRENPLRISRSNRADCEYRSDLPGRTPEIGPAWSQPAQPLRTRTRARSREAKRMKSHTMLR